MTDIRPVVFARAVLSSTFVVGALAVLAACSSTPGEETSRPFVKNLGSAGSSSKPAGVSGLADAPDSEYDWVPGGRRLHQSCIHAVPRGGRLDSANHRIYDAAGNLVEQYENCAYIDHAPAAGRLANAPTGSAPPKAPLSDPPIYQEYSGADATTQQCGNTGYPFYHPLYCAPWFNAYVGYVQVPDNPTDQGQILYLWGGIMAGSNLPPGATAQPLLQTVLQWRAAGRSNSCNQGLEDQWSFNEWYIDAFNTATCWYPVPINPGDWVIMKQAIIDNYNCTVGGTTGGSGCDWVAQGWRNSDLVNETYSVPAVAGTFDQTFRAVLEAYDVNNASNPACNVYPDNGGTTFSNMASYQPRDQPGDYHLLNQTWQPVTHYNITPYCHYGQTAGTQSQTYLYFGQ